MDHLNIAHMVVSSLIHGLIYALIFKIYHQLGLVTSVAVTVLGVAAIWLGSRWWQGRRRTNTRRRRS
jgi:hypothetical protein